MARWTCHQPAIRHPGARTSSSRWNVIARDESHRRRTSWRLRPNPPTAVTGSPLRSAHMNPETIDSEYAKLQQQADQTGSAVQAFAQKMQAAVDGGDANAREWLLDLKSVALQVQQEQLQVQSLLQAMHDFTVNHMSAPPQPVAYQ